ncbi:MAG: hypothetical protein ACRD6N_02825 [Pyrinomonadaceae bacterium]
MHKRSSVGKTAFGDLKERQQVEARFTGPVIESYLVQATADEITILKQ